MQAQWRPTIRNGLIQIPCALYRGGTSKGPVFLASDLPQSDTIRRNVIQAALNSTHQRQVDGVGGGDLHANKAVIVGPSDREDADVTYHFIQFYPGSRDYSENGTCGNMSAVVSPFAIERGLVTAEDEATSTRIYCGNSSMILRSTVATPGGELTFEGDGLVAGVDGSAASVEIAYLKPFGALTNSTFPTGNVRDCVDGVEFTMVDAGGGISLVVSATAFGFHGLETKQQLDEERAFASRLESFRQKVGRMIGTNDVESSPVPSINMVGCPAAGGTIASRILSTRRADPAICHPAHTLSGAVGLSVALATVGTVPFDIADLSASDRPNRVGIEHPAGIIDIGLTYDQSDLRGQLVEVTCWRTSRKLMDGSVHISRAALERCGVAIG